jgi:plasmid stabilization system protein ParE
VSIDYTPDAQVDILEAVDYFVNGPGTAVARAFRHRLHQTLTGLEAFPHSGSPVDPPYPNFPGLRVRPVMRFRSQLVFYQPTPTGILVVRVVHGSQDLDAVFA